MLCCQAARPKGGVILLHGVALDAIPLPRMDGITVLPAGPNPDQTLGQAMRLAASGSQIALQAPADQPAVWPKMLRKARIPFATAFLHRSPAQLVAAAAGPTQALDLLESFYTKMTGSRDSHVPHAGPLRHADLRRAMAQLRKSIPPGSALTNRCTAVEHRLTTALGLADRRSVYLVPRRAAHVVVPVAQATRLSREMAPHLEASRGRVLRAGSSLTTAPTTTTKGLTPTTPPTGSASKAVAAATTNPVGSGGGTGACVTYNIKQNDLNAAAVRASTLGGDESLANLRAALKATAPANGMMFLQANNFPVSSADEATTIASEIATDCILTMSSQATNSQATAEAAAASGQAAAANAAATQANVDAMRGNLAPAATAGPLPDATIATGGASAAGTVEQVVDLTMNQWQKVFQANNLLRGFSVTANGIKPAPKQPWVWNPDAMSYAVQDGSIIQAKLCKSLASADSVASGFTSTSVGVSAGIPAGASVGLSVGSDSAQSDSEATSSQETTLLTQWLYPRAKIWPQPSLRLSDQYLADLREALDATKEPSAVTRAANLNEVLLAYGDFYPESVTLGGKAYQMEASEASGNWSGSSTTKSTNVGVSAGYGPVSADVGTSKGSDNADNASTSGSSANNNYQTTGGNGLLNGNSDLWIQSVGQAANWRIIEYGMLTEMTEFLPDDITAAMTELTDATPSVQVVTDPKNTNYTMSLDKQFLKLSLKSSGLSLGVLSGAKPGDAAILRRAAAEDGFNNATIWYAEWKSTGLTLRSEGTIGAETLYLTQKNNQLVTLQALKVGSAQTDQLWTLADINGTKALVSNRNYLAAGQGKSKIIIQADINRDDLAPAVFDKKDYGSKDDYGLLTEAASSLAANAEASLDDLKAIPWNYLVQSWTETATELYMKVKESDGSDSTYDEKYYIDFADLNVASWDMMTVEERRAQFNTLLGTKIQDKASDFKSYVEDSEGKVIKIEEIYYKLAFPSLTTMAPAPSEAQMCKLTSPNNTTTTGFEVTQVDVSEVAKSIPSSESMEQCACCRQGWASAAVGSSPTNTKTVDLSETTRVDWQTGYVVNDPSYSSISDTLILQGVDNKARSAIVKRTDSTGGWGQNPTLLLCPSSAAVATAPTK